MSNVPDKSLFSVNERPRQYEAKFEVRGVVFMTFQADSIEEARAMAEAVQGDEEFGLTIDEVESVDVQRVRKTPPMFRVIRDGKSMQVSMLAPGDLPREPDERGF